LYCLSFETFLSPQDWLYEYNFDDERCTELDTYIPKAEEAWRVLASSACLQIQPYWIEVMRSGVLHVTHPFQAPRNSHLSSSYLPWHLNIHEYNSLPHHTGG
jgi:hypothetical protein